MDILYYSNYCKHCKQILLYVTKNNLMDKMNFICVDKRSKDVNNNQTYFLLDNGKTVIQPPNVHSVPSLLQIKKNYSVIMGEDIIQYFKMNYTNHLSTNSQILQTNGEPMGAYLPNSSQKSNIISEQFTMYNMTPEELSAKGSGASRQINNYVPATHTIKNIPTPDDNYKPDKLSNAVTVDILQQQRNQDLTNSNAPSPSLI